jgi:hypothetical protein
LAGAARQAGLAPVFPVLEPGGDFWDLSFLRLALSGLERRSPDLVNDLALAAAAPTGTRPLDWGIGGPERWPAARPYQTPVGSQDHLGLRLYDWYQALARAILGRSLPLFLLEAGGMQAGMDPVQHASRALAIARLLAGSPAEEGGESLEPIPAEVAAGCFWLLSAAPGSRQAAEAFFPPSGEPLPAVNALRSLAGQASPAAKRSPAPTAARDARTTPAALSHYLLLPAYDWGVDEWHLEALLPFIHLARPALGFSLAEACLARRVTVAGGVQAYPPEAIASLQAAGCQVERILPDGTILAQ